MICFRMAISLCWRRENFGLGEIVPQDLAGSPSHFRLGLARTVGARQVAKAQQSRHVSCFQAVNVISGTEQLDDQLYLACTQFRH
jgi:hypothetical protein